VEVVDEHPVYLVGTPVGAGGIEEGGEGRGEAVQGLHVELGLAGREIASGLDALGEAINAREREGHQVDERGQRRRDRAEPAEDTRGGHEGHAVAVLYEALGELEAWDQVTEREPRKMTMCSGEESAAAIDTSDRLRTAGSTQRLAAIGELGLEGPEYYNL